MAAEGKNALIPPKRANTDYPVRSIYLLYIAGGMAAASPLAFWAMERVSPSHVGRGGFAPVMRLATAIGLIGEILQYVNALKPLVACINPSIDRFYGFTENAREVEMDMREMVDKVKKGEPLYGTSQVSSYLQGVAARNSRYSQLFIHVLPWFNIVNHDQHGVDTAKYYQQAERELEAERLTTAGSH
ncbi:hypothetical protein ACP6JE_008509 [Aspergillus fumigatus]